MATNIAPTFTVSGFVRTDFGSSDIAQSLLVQSDGTILMGGGSGSFQAFAVGRYLSDGTLDSSFDADGKVTTVVQSGVTNQIYGLALQPDGKIVAAGYVDGGVDFALARYNVDGSLDTSFDSDGKLTTSFGSGQDMARAVAVQADGKIVAGGVASTNSFGLVRYTATGVLDTTFDGDGKVITSFASGRSEAWDLGIQADGKIVLAGYADTDSGNGSDFALARYNTDGSLDTTFDGDGRVTSAVGPRYEHAWAVTFQADGKILAAGESEETAGSLVNDFAVARYNTDGTLDTTFGGDGSVTTDFGGSDSAYGVAVQSDGRVVVAGSSQNNFALVRYNADGTVDTSFAVGGKAVTNFGFNVLATSLAIQADGKILVGGHTTTGAPDFLFARYNSDGTLDRTFGQGLSTLDGVAAFTEGSASAVMDSNVQVYDAELAAQGNYGGATLTLARHGGASADDRFMMSGPPDPLTEGGALLRSGATVGTVTTNSGGTLVLTFNSNATQTLVNAVLQSLNYSNLSDAPPASVQIDWSFSDGNTGGQGTGGALAASGSTTVNITGVNDAPTISGLDGAVDYVQGTPAVVLEPDATVFDKELSASGNYAGATITLGRRGVVSADDLFSATGSLGTLTQGSTFTYGGVTVGTVTTNSGGRLVLTFNSNATQARVDGVLESIAYSNVAVIPANIQIEWRFSDGNTGAQGTNGALTSNGFTLVTVGRVYLWSQIANGAFIQPFNTEVSALRFDDSTISAADVRVNAARSAMAARPCSWRRCRPGTGRTPSASTTAACCMPATRRSARRPTTRPTRSPAAPATIT